LADRRDAVLAACDDGGITARPAWTPMHRLKMYEHCPRMDLGTAEDLYRRLIALPSSPRLAAPAHG
ncbi:MAG: DegT/DnrJ/EryC1/StrS family aminotransferase, partial [Alphaproteobacteria bacterium]|nr:DegT/DnrJ/EryC1/StrS family aminotransferase [Alphaproteobacteria bacterium]MCZ6743424.1 DegT/DnrJ/EryC1/StrS family aminotransferase [Alphaproteobacteria bacterium]